MEDFLYKYLGFFYNLPLPVKSMLGHLYNLLPKRWKYGKFYFSYRERIRQFVGLDADGAATEQQKLLLLQVNNAIRHIPYYKSHKNCNSVEDFH